MTTPSTPDAPHFPSQRFEWPLVQPNPKFKELLDEVQAGLNQTQGKPMADSIEATNERIAFLTAGMVKVPLSDDGDDTQYGTTVALYAKEAGGEPALEITTYDPGTPIDGEHAGLLEEAPDMAKLLHGDVEDLTTTRVVLLDLADGVDGGDELQTEGERSQFGLGVAAFAQELLDSNPDAGDQLRQTYVDESGQTQPVAKINFTPDEGAQMVDGKISGTAEISIPGKDASTHPFDGVVSDTVVETNLMANYKYAIPLNPPGPDTPTRLYTDAAGINRISDVAMSPADRAADLLAKASESELAPMSQLSAPIYSQKHLDPTAMTTDMAHDKVRAEVDKGYAEGRPATEAQLEALDPLGQEEEDEGGSGI